MAAVGGRVAVAARGIPRVRVIMGGPIGAGGPRLLAEVADDPGAVASAEVSMPPLPPPIRPVLPLVLLAGVSAR